MLKEIAFTPFVFDEAFNTSNRRWAESLSEMARFLFPLQAPCTCLVSNLHKSNWLPIVLEKISNCTDHSLKVILQQFFTKVNDYLVERPSVTDFEYPGGNDDMWADEALQSSQTHGEIDKIFTCHETAQGQDNFFEVREFLSESFINTLLVNNLVPMVIDEQIARLKQLCLHASYISISSAYFRGAELDFAKHLIQKAGSRPSNFSNVVIDIHLEIPEDKDEQERIMNYVRRRLKENMNERTIIRLYGWKKIRERVLLAGDQTTVSGQLRFKPRWGINTYHIARFGETNLDDKTNWSIMKKNEIIHWNKVYYQFKPILGPLDVEH